MCSECRSRGSTSNLAEAEFRPSRWAAIGGIDVPRSTPGSTVSKSVRRAFATMSESACRAADVGVIALPQFAQSSSEDSSGGQSGRGGCRSGADYRTPTVLVSPDPFAACLKQLAATAVGNGQVRSGCAPGARFRSRDVETEARHPRFHRQQPTVRSRDHADRYRRT